MSRHHIEQIHESTSNLQQLCTHKYSLYFALGNRLLWEMQNQEHHIWELSLKSVPVLRIRARLEEIGLHFDYAIQSYRASISDVQCTSVMILQWIGAIYLFVEPTSPSTLLFNPTQCILWLHWILVCQDSFWQRNYYLFLSLMDFSLYFP